MQHCVLRCFFSLTFFCLVSFLKCLQKEEKDKFRKDLKGRPKHNHTPPTENLATEQTSADVDSNTKAFIEVEREKVLNKRKYAEDLLKVSSGYARFTLLDMNIVV